MKKLIQRVSWIAIVATAAGASNLASTVAWAQPITRAKAAELGCHRIERLVLLKKIDEAFVNRFARITVLPLSPAAATDPAFRVTSYQVPSAGGAATSAELLLDSEGKALSHQVTFAGDSHNSPSWPGVDAITLAENALHYVLDHFESDPRLLPFYQGLTELFLQQALSATGQVQAQVDLHAVETRQILRVMLTSDGAFESSVVLEPSLERLTSFEDLKTRIFEPHCIECHSEGGSAHRVPLSTREDLLDSPRELVIPGDPDSSGLVIAVSRADTDRKRMPPPSSGSPRLSDQDIALIRQWILDGAKN